MCIKIKFKYLQIVYLYYYQPCILFKALFEVNSYNECFLEHLFKKFENYATDITKTLMVLTSSPTPQNIFLNRDRLVFTQFLT